MNQDLYKRIAKWNICKEFEIKIWTKDDIIFWNKCTPITFDWGTETRMSLLLPWRVEVMVICVIEIQRVPINIVHGKNQWLSQKSPRLVGQIL